MTENSRYLSDDQETFNCFEDRGAPTLVRGRIGLFICRLESLAQKKYIKVFEHPSLSRNDSKFSIDMPREEAERSVLYSLNIATGPYCEAPEFNPYH